MEFISYKVDGNYVFTNASLVTNIIFDKKNDKVYIRTLDGGNAACDGNSFKFVDDSTVRTMRDRMNEV